MSVRLDPVSVEEIAVRVAALLSESAPATNGRLLTTREVARRLGRSPDFVRQHRAELGGVPAWPNRR